MIKGLIIKLTILCYLFSHYNSSGQDRNDFKLNVELDLVQPIFGGYGGTIGLEKNHWGFGAMGFSTPLNDRNRNFILKGAEDFNVRNWGTELYINYFLDKAHNGFHFGALISADGYQMRHKTEKKETIIGIYAVPKIGYRWVVFKKFDWFYLQPSIATPILIWHDAPKIEIASINPSKVLFLPMLTVGFKINL